jgi:hypothetical protein
LQNTSNFEQFFKCTEIDPTCLSGEVVNAVRKACFRRLFIYKLIHHPLQTFRLLRRFARHMRYRDLAYLIVKPFLGAKRGATKAENLSRAVEHGMSKDSAAELTKVSDDALEQVVRESNLERSRLQEKEAVGAGDAASG